MKILKGEAVAYIARGTYSSIMRLVTTSEIPQPVPEIILLMHSIQMFMNYVKTPPMQNITPVMRRALRLPMLIIWPALRAPMHAPML